MAGQDGRFANNSQRVAYSYMRSLTPVPHTDTEELLNLHAFFTALYAALFDSPARFGLPELPDDCITGEEPDRTKKLGELNRKLKKPREMIGAGLDFLMLAGEKGQVVAGPNAGEQMLLLDSGEYAALVKSSKIKKPFLQGLAGVGVVVSEQGSSVAMRSARFPAMLPALKKLAAACARAATSTQRDEANLGRFNFARCELQAIDPGYHPSPLDLYRVFPAEQYARAMQLHEYFTARNYKTIVQIYGIHGWEVKYQGSRQAKSTPLAEIVYAERFQNPLRAFIKCASTGRIAPHLARQPRSLQEDFFRRVFTCGDCGWCRNKKTLGPTLIEFGGEQKNACWYANPEIKEFNDDAVALIQQYVVLHETLA